MAAVDYFLKLDGIEGESTDAKHKGGSCSSRSAGASACPGAGAGGGGGAGKAQFQDLVIVLRTTKASPKLFLACATGQHLKSVVLTARKAGKAPLEFLTITLGDVLVSSFQETGSAGEVPLETVSLTYAKVEIAYRPQSATGKAGAAGEGRLRRQAEQADLASHCSRTQPPGELDEFGLLALDLFVRPDGPDQRFGSADPAKEARLVLTTQALPAK